MLFSGDGFTVAKRGMGRFFLPDSPNSSGCNAVFLASFALEDVLGKIDREAQRLRRQTNSFHQLLTP